MSMNFHEDPVYREEFITGYLQRRLSADLAEQWESHYLACEDCFEEIRATELLIRGLGEPMVESKRVQRRHRAAVRAGHAVAGLIAGTEPSFPTSSAFRRTPRC